jgi:nicotinamidase-related amidase
VKADSNELLSTLEQKVSPAHTALLVVDVQNDFVADGGFFIDYYVSLVTDCCAGATERDHLAAIERFERDYGAVVTSADVIDAWERSGALAAHPVASPGR